MRTLRVATETNLLAVLAMVDLGRRRLIQTLAGAAGALAAFPLLAAETHDLTIRGCRLIDPRQAIDAACDIAVTDGRVSAIGQGPFAAREVIDATGMIVAPGFVDLLADNPHNPRRTYPVIERYKLADGVTTSLQCHGGSADVGSYYETFSALPHMTNHGVSSKIMRIRRRTRSQRRRLRLAERCLEQGALAVSHSIEYQPTPFAELLRYGELAARWGVPFFLHLRFSSRGQELEGVREALHIGAETGCHMHLDHLHSTGASWHMGEAIELVEEALARGQQVTACVYPYTNWATYVHSKRFGKGWRERYGLDFDDLAVVGTGERLTRGTFMHYRKRTFALVAVPEGTMSLEHTLLPALRRPWVMIASDGGIEREPRANNHPRGAGCFATALALARDHQIPLVEMIRKMTDLPASLLRSRAPGMELRGSLRRGDVADLVLFDPNEVAGRATVENPNQLSAGIEMVMVGGKVAYRDGEFTDVRVGQPIQGKS
ncbi:MAG: amidohydrolase family protein [Deltaproteobacteria bacterium]|nr:amidohydrolase family protein [Deltaproteobacteria bacterium]